MLDTVQPIVNSSTTNESERMSWKLMESTMLPYVILGWSGIWTVIEHSRRFWVVIQGEKEWKKVNKMGNVPDCGHDITPPLD